MLIRTVTPRPGLQRTANRGVVAPVDPLFAASVELTGSAVLDADDWRAIHLLAGAGMLPGTVGHETPAPAAAS